MDRNHRVLVFGEAEKGEFCRPLRLKGLEDLLNILGSPPDGSLGLDYAIQTLLCKWDLIFYRVHEEGYSIDDYNRGLQLLANQGQRMYLSAICMPGVGDPHLLNAVSPICQSMNLLLLVSEQDFYDYLTGSKY